MTASERIRAARLARVDWTEYLGCTVYIRGRNEYGIVEHVADDGSPLIQTESVDELLRVAPENLEVLDESPYLGNSAWFGPSGRSD
jgi:hypothetical protein